MSEEPAWKVRLRRLQALAGGAPEPPPSDGIPADSSSSTPAEAGDGTRSPNPALLAAQARARALASPTPGDGKAKSAPTPGSAPSASASASAAAAAARSAAPAASLSRPSVPTPSHSTSTSPAPAPKPIPRPSSVASTSSAAAIPLGRPVARTPVPPTPTKPTRPYIVWESEQIERTLNVTVSQERAEAADWSIVYLEEVAADLKAEGKPTVVLPADSIDALLIARLSLDPSATMTDSLVTMSVLAALPAGQTATAYLLGCYGRLLPLQPAAAKAGYTSAEVERWKATWRAVKDGLVGYLAEILKDPGMFPQPESTAERPVGPPELLPLLLDPAHGASGSRPLLPATYLPLLLSDLATHGDEPAEFAEKVLSPLMATVFQRYWTPAEKAENQSLTGGGWDKYLGAIERVTQSKETAGLMGSLPIWLLETATAPQIEFMSLLGPFLRLSTFPREFPEIMREYFSNPTDRDRSTIQAAQKTLQASLFTLQERLFGVLNAIVRSGPVGRETVLALLARIVEANKRRAGSRVPRETVSSDGFMANVFAVVLRFAEPFMDVAFSKLDKVDPHFFLKSKRIDLGDVTRLRATQAEADEYASAQTSASAAGPPPNFISEVYWLACALMHVGLGKTVGTRNELERKIGDIERDIQRLEADDSWKTGGEAVRQQGEALMKKLKDQLTSIHASLHAFDAQLLDPDFIARTMTLQTFVMTWFVRLVDPTSRYPAEMISLPLPEESPVNFRMLPEYILEDIADYHVFLISHSPQTFDTADQTKLITFIITFLSGKYVKNPFVKAKLVEFLSMGCQAWGSYRQGVLGPALAFHPLATEQLVPSLIAYYIDMEATGGHQQFYDKFSMRRHAISILRYLFKNPVHREAFEKDSVRNEDRFVIFANMHMNDCTFLLEESLTSLTKIYQLETEMADAAGWARRDEAERKDKTEELKSAENQAAWSTDGGRRNIAVLKEWTEQVKEPFLKAEIIDRLAAMLCFNLATLVGPKMQELKVRDPKKYRFDAKSLLGDLTDIFRNLGTEQRFVEAVAREGRSYRKEVFASLARILQHRAVKTQGEIQQIVLFCDKVEETRLKIEAEEEGEDLPDEFLDPLMYTLMRDPVLLPSSKITIDRSTIKSHLLSDPTDPFNRMPLKLEECESDVELKAKIAAYLAGRRMRNVEPMHVDGVADA